MPLAHVRPLDPFAFRRLHHHNSAAALDFSFDRRTRRVTDDDLVTRCNQVDEAVLHAHRTRTRDRERQRSWSERIAQQRLQLLHHSTNTDLDNRCHHARIDLTGQSESAAVDGRLEGSSSFPVNEGRKGCLLHRDDLSRIARVGFSQYVYSRDGPVGSTSTAQRRHIRLDPVADHGSRAATRNLGLTPEDGHKAITATALAGSIGHTPVCRIKVNLTR